MSEALELIVEKYLSDSKYQEEQRNFAEKRNTTLPTIQPIIYDFIQRKINIHQLRQKLDSPKEMLNAWYAQGFGFMMELNKFSKYHSENTSRPEEYLRTILTGLKASNVGQRIEQFYTFLLDEQKRLRQASQRNSVAPGNSAFIISLFAFWLDPAAQPAIYKEAARRGMYQLIKGHYLETPAGLRTVNNTIEIISEANQLAYQKVLAELNIRFPQLKINAYWSECFGYWLAEYFQQLTQQVIPVFKEPDGLDILSTPPAKTPSSEDTSTPYIPTGENHSHFIDNDPLTPTPEPLLTQLIHEVQRHILVEEPVIRRIYHALLAGHVILTGPPGTGKTELARFIPEILWSSDTKTAEQADGSSETAAAARDTKTAYTTRIVTATDEWSVRTLISGIAPQSKNGSVTYNMQYGYLTTTILKNWLFNANRPEEWGTLRRTAVVAQSSIERGTQQTFRGQWLVIDEFNRAPIDLALGDALTALGGNDVLRVQIEGGSAELPIPHDFRLLGTLNSFDRNYLNQISEALKRRFSFVEILPPSRIQRTAEQGIVLYKALSKIRHLSDGIDLAEDGILYWEGGAIIEPGENGLHIIEWDDRLPVFHEAFASAWRTFEVIRIYRQLGTAQAISLVQHMLIAGIMQGYNTREAWIEYALDAALCDTLADQLQILLPDEIEALLLYLTTDHNAFSEAYNKLLARLTPSRLYGQLLSLGSVTGNDDHVMLTDEEIEQIASQNQPSVAPSKLSTLFHLAYPANKLPQFTRRLRTFKAERGL